MKLKTGHVIDLTALESEPTPERPSRRGFYSRFGKRAFDLAVAVPLAILTLPVVAITLLVSVVICAAPPLVRLQSIGRDGRVFGLFRVRTALSVPRVKGLRVATSAFLRRWRLDQIPALWNVVLGDMSLVGPRPLRPAEHRRLQDWQQQRTEVKPGLIGLRRVDPRSNGSTTTSTLHYDILYIDRMSLATDVRILVRSLPFTKRRRNGNVAAPQTDPPLHWRLMTADIALWAVGVPLATWASSEFEFSSLRVGPQVLAIALALVVHMVWATRNGMYRGRWKLIAPDELTTLSVGAGLATAGLLVIGWLSPWLPPNGALLMAGALYLVGAITSRLYASFMYTKRAQSLHDRNARLLVFGAGEAGLDTVKAIMTDQESDLMPVGFLDDNPKLHKSTLLGLPVLGGRESIDEVARRYGAGTLLVALPSAHPETVDQIADIGREAGLEVQVLPPMAKWLSALLVERSASVTPNGARQTPVAPERNVGTFDLAVIGLGYVGLPLVVEAERNGLRVLGIDISSHRVDQLMAGRSYIEDIDDAELAEALLNGFIATTDFSLVGRADAISINVPTPLRDGLPDLSAVIGACESIAPHLRSGQLVVLESTTYPGTTEEVVRPLLESRSGLRAGVDFHLAYSPERINPGSGEFGVHNTPKLVAGIDEASAEEAAMLYRKFAPVVTMSGTREAEMAKILENTYRHVNIALINEMAIYCHQLGVDIWETIRGAATKPFGFQAFYPGPGVGGHCIPIDPNYLSYKVRQLGEQFRFIELAQEINEYMPRYVVDRAADLLQRRGLDMDGAKILLIGVAYKPDVSDVRETPATGIIEILQEAGAHVEYADPHVKSFEVRGSTVPRQPDAVAAAADFDLTIVHTPHRALDIDAIAAAATLVFDLRGETRSDKYERL